MTDVTRAWMEDQRRAGLAASTIDQRRRVLVRWQKVAGDLLDPRQADDGAMRRFLAASPIEPKSLAVLLSHLRAFYTWAQLNDLCMHDPTVKVARPKLGRSLPRPIDREGLRFAMAVAPPRTQLMLGLGAGAGLRCMEIAGLLWRDVLLEGDEPRLQLTHTKGHRDRTVPLRPELVALLEAVELRAVGYVIRSERQPLEPVTAQHVSRVIGRHLRGCGIDATAHQLRHLFVTVACEHSDDLLAVAQMAGHASVTTTQIYAEVAGKRARVVVDAMPPMF